MRPHDATGIVEYYAERRAKYAGLAYKAPVIITAQPIEVKKLTDPERTSLIGKIESLKADLAAATAENLQLQTLIAEFVPHNVPTTRAPVALRAVQAAFCEAMNAAGRAADDGSEWSIDHLKAPRRSADLARPRQVCMWLCKKICATISLPQIGRAFGGRDHTTAMHAVRRAPVHMAADADLHFVALTILRQFDCAVPLEMGEAP